MRLHSPALLCCLLVCCSVADARDWRSSWDEVVAQGDFVRLLGRNVQVKTETGKRVTLHLTDLCREDQLFVQQQTLARLGKAPATPRIKAKASWEPAGVVGDKSLLLAVTLSAQGRDLENASRVGDVLIDEIETDGPSTLELSGNWTGASSMSEADHKDSAPKHGLLFKLLFKDCNEPITRIRRLRGSFKIVTGDPETIAVKEPASVKDRTLDDPLLKDLGVNIVVNPSGSNNSLLSLLAGPHTTAYKLRAKGKLDRILRIMPTDSDGNWHYPPSGCSYGSSDDYSYQFNFEPPGPKDVEFRITLLTERREERVSFDLSDLKVPKRKKPKN